MVLSAAAPAAAAGPALDGTATPTGVGVGATPPAAEAANATNTTGDGAAASVSPTLQSADGTVEVVARLAEQSGGLAASTAAATRELKAHAASSQQAVLAFAADRDGVRVQQRFWITNAVVLEVDTDRVPLGELAGVEGVQRLHPNFEVETPAPVGPRNGSAVEESAAAAPAGEQDTTYGLEQINATGVWSAFGTQGGGVKVAVLDSGVDVSHPAIDLYTTDPGNATYPGGWAEFDETGDRVRDGEGPSDANYHGTHVSGTVAGDAASGTAIGVAPDAELMHGQVLGPQGGTFGAVVGGMEWAVENGADVVTMSIGPPSGHAYYDFMIEPVQNAQAAGVVVISSSGNAGPGTSGSPANVYETIAVGASGPDRGVAGFSSGEVVDTSADWGANASASWPAEYVVPDVAAPGVDVLSAIPEGTIPTRPTVKYGYLNGTSMAAPHVAGATALVVAAAGGEATPSAVEQALRASASKPDDCGPSCDPRAGNDTRYGAGIIDAGEAAAMLAVDAGVNGTVTGTDGDPVADATVRLEGGLETTTDADGTYRLRAAAGTYDLAVDAFGYESATSSATVTAGNYTTTDVTLTPRLATERLDGQPSGVVAGETIAVTYRVAHVDSVTVNATGDYDAGSATLTVNGQSATFGEPVSLDDYSGTLTVAVATGPDATGSLGLATTVGGAGDAATLETGPTTVYGETIPVAVADTASGQQFGTDVAAALAAALPANYELTVVNGTAEMTARVDEFAAVVVQNTSGPTAAADLQAAARQAGTGLVVLNQHGYASNGVADLSDATGNPGVYHQQSAFPDDVGQTPFNAISYDVLASDHPIFAGVDAGSDGYVKLHEAGYHGWFTDVDGRTLAGTAYQSCGFFGCSNVTQRGSGLVVDELSRTVYASTLGRAPFPAVDYYDYFTDAADRIAANAVEWVATDTGVTLADAQADHVGTGETIATTFDVANLTRATVRLDARQSTVARENLSLYVNGKVAAWGQALAYDALDGDLAVEVVPDDGVTGTVSLDYTLVAGGRTLNGSTGATSVYDAPVTVGEDAASIQSAVDLVVQGGEVVVPDGTYRERVEVRSARNRDVTIRAAEGADPLLFAEAEHGNVPGFHLAADGVTLRGVDVHINETFDNGVMVAAEDQASDPVRGVTVQDLSITGGEFGVRLGLSGKPAPGAVVENVTVEGADGGIAVDRFDGARVVDNTVRDVDADGLDDGDGIWLYGAENTVVENNTVAGAVRGVVASTDSNASRIAGNDVSGVTDGVVVEGHSRDVAVTDNTVTRAKHAVRIDGTETTAEVTRNDLDGQTGVYVEGVDAAGLVLEYNDLADTGVAVDSEAAGRLDARLNYYGPRGATAADGRRPAASGIGGGDPGGPGDRPGSAAGVPTVSGDVVFDPFLTEPPGALDAAPSETTAIATEVTLPAGETTALAVPGPVQGTVGDVFGQFRGVIYGFDAESQSWHIVHGGDSLSTLQALAVVPTTDARAVLSFESSGPAAPGQTPLVEGWNFVGAPTAGPVESAFEPATAEITIASAAHGAPGSQLTPRGTLAGTHRFSVPGDGPTVSPFQGYFVFSEGEGVLPGLLASDPTMSELYGAFGLDPRVDHGDGGDGNLGPTSAVRAAAQRAAADAAATTSNRSEVVAATERAALAAAYGTDLDADALAAIVDAAVADALDADADASTASLHSPRAALAA